jgi:hypothetical protein
MTMLANAVDQSGTPAVGISLSTNQVPIPGAVVVTASTVNVSGGAYAFEIRTPWDQVWKQSGLDPIQWAQYQPPVPGVYWVRALVKTSTGTVVASPPTPLDVTTTGPGVSALAVTTTPATTKLAVGSAFTISAKATDAHGTAWYQFRVKSPAGKWTATPYGSTNTVTYKNLKAGKWVFEVRALDKSQVGTKSAWQAYTDTIRVTVGG